MNAFTIGVWNINFAKGLSGPNQNRSPTLDAALSSTTNSQLVLLTSAVSISPMTSISSKRPLPKPFSYQTDTGNGHWVKAQEP